LKGNRDLDTGLWRINTRQKELQTRKVTAKAQTQISEANNIYNLHNTGALVNYLYKAMFICTKSDLINAIKRCHLATWPGLTEEAINKHLKMTPATAMGHMHQKRKKIRSTNKEVKPESEDEEITPSGKGEKTHFVFVVVLDQGQIYTDLTGNLTERSSKGHNVLML
jgi:hypothetical protein